MSRRIILRLCRSNIPTKESALCPPLTTHAYVLLEPGKHVFLLLATLNKCEGRNHISPYMICVVRGLVASTKKEKGKNMFSQIEKHA